MKRERAGVKLFLFAAVLFAATTAFAHVQQAGDQKASEAEFTPTAPLDRTTTRSVPEYSFILEPHYLGVTFYDFMPGSYLSYPLRVQDDQAPGDNGVYIGYHRKDAFDATRQAYFSYYREYPYSSATTPASFNDRRQGYVGVDLDPVTHDPFFVWHSNCDEDELYECELTYNMYHLLESPGLQAQPFIVLETDTYAGVHSPASDDEYIWSYVHVIKSPTFNVDGRRRIFVIASNYTSNSGNPSESVLIKWTDFTTSDLEMDNLAQLEWTYLTFPLLDAYNLGPTCGRYQHAAAFNDQGQCALIGYLNADDLGHNGCDTKLLVFYNDNWGEGE